MLDHLHPDIRVLATSEPATDAEVASLNARFPSLPDLLKQLMLTATEIELSYRGRYLRLYGPGGCIDMDSAYNISSAIPNSLTIGDNGGCEAIVMLADGSLVRAGYATLDETHFVADSLSALLIDATASADDVGSIYGDHEDGG
ncbi:hypothetical protein SAMN06265222_1583 [Neorhodopirellula lusitana]|uniref:Uncharacterized protein n=1 Tax=Neorhodopirellula lusitana TaxID=445327 RepID=A0ABY1QVQ3_9BACT|nr:hypothetical protein [Neorhodopirellula lusitana]SMP80604.1 hypothetical protein SAMN06265222_1583 [Neorhodopirellula lusitana]